MPDIPYHFSMLLVCDDDKAVQVIEFALEEAVRPFRKEGGDCGVVLNEFEVETADTVTLKRANSYTRLSDWDDVSSFGDVLEDHLRTLIPGSV